MIAVVGSLNIDYIATVERLPAPGETVPATRFIRRFGGKGANQALAAARQGARVCMIGCVGQDADGKAYRKRLQNEGIITRGIFVTKKSITGSAMIAVDRYGENIIVVAPGANGELRASMIRAQRRQIVLSRIVLLQMEAGLPAVIEAARIANENGIPAVLNPSPVRRGIPWGKWSFDTVIVNEHEMQDLFGLAVHKVSGWQRLLTKWRIQTVIITQGAKPTFIINSAGSIRIPAMKVRPVDTVGAGDVFAGCYVARRAEGLDVPEAARYANCAGALATLKAGAQEAIPIRAATEKAARQLDGLIK